MIEILTSYSKRGLKKILPIEKQVVECLADHLHILLLVLSQHLGDGDEPLERGLRPGHRHKVLEVSVADVMQSGQVARGVVLDRNVFRRGLVLDVGQVVQEGNHLLLVLEDERVDDFHVALLSSKLNKVCQVLQALGDHDQRAGGLE